MTNNMENNSEKQQPKKKLPLRIIIAIAIVGLLFLIGKKVWHALNHETTDNAQVEMRLVPILSRVSGYIDRIYVEDYATIKKGQLLLDIDSTELQLQLDELQADYNQAVSDIENIKASLTNTEATVLYSKGNVDVIALRKEKAMNDFNRDKNLFEANAITQKQFDDSRSNFEINMKLLETGRSDVHVAETRLNMIHSQLAKAYAQAELKRARLEQQKLKINYCRVYATSDGKLGKRNVDEGQFIQAGTPLFTLVNSQNVWIVANFKEDQVKHIHIGQLVEIKIDGFPRLEVKGKVASLSAATGARFSLLPPDNATGNFIKVTQRIPVKIEILSIEKYRNILCAGMSTDVSIPIE